MIPLAAFQANPYAQIPRLAPGQLLVVEEGGGQLGYRGRLVVREDGTVTVSRTKLQSPQATKRWRLAKGELGALRLLIQHADFDALHRTERPPNPPSAVDGIDRTLAVRQGKAVRGWSNVLWTPPAAPPPLFIRVQEIFDRSPAGR